MTVGIAVISQESSGPKVVLAADRMITTGRSPRIEYEHTKSKIQTIHDDEVVSCMGVASGTVSFIEEFFHRLENELSETEPLNVRDVAEKAREVYTELGQDTVQNQVLDKLDIDLSDLSENKHDYDSDVLSSLLSDVNEAQENFASQLEALIVGVDGFGGHIFSIQGFDMDPQNNIGYHAVGSGTQPARSVFIRNEYSTEESVDRAILNTIEAKHRSEEARGVGTEMDIAIVNQPAADADCCEVIDDSDKKEWEEVYQDIVDAEQEARDGVISDSGLKYEQGGQQ